MESISLGGQLNEFGNFETKKPINFETKKPINQETKKRNYQETKKPKNLHFPEQASSIKHQQLVRNPQTTPFETERIPEI